MGILACPKSVRNTHPALDWSVRDARRVVLAEHQNLTVPLYSSTFFYPPAYSLS